MSKHHFGILLVLGAVAQLADTLISFLFPDYDGLVMTVLGVLGFSEILFCLWLLIMGAKEQPQVKRTLEPACS